MASPSRSTSTTATTDMSLVDLTYVVVMVGWLFGVGLLAHADPALIIVKHRGGKVAERQPIIDHLLDYVADRIDEEMDDDLIETVIKLRKGIPHEEFVKMSFKGS